MDAAVFSALSGRGHRCVGRHELTAFDKELDARNAWIDIVEAFEVSNGAETPRIELSIYGDHGSYDLSARERRKAAAERLARLLAAIDAETAKFCFNVWADGDCQSPLTTLADVELLGWSLSPRFRRHSPEVQAHGLGGIQVLLPIVPLGIGTVLPLERETGYSAVINLQHGLGEALFVSD